MELIIIIILSLKLPYTGGFTILSTVNRLKPICNGFVTHGDTSHIICRLRKSDEGDNENIDAEFDAMFDSRFKKMKQASKSDNSSIRKSGKSGAKAGQAASGNFAFLSGLNKWEVLNRAVVAGVFVAGIGTGITIDSAINTNPDNLASRDAIDRNAPNPKLCLTYGSSAIALDQRIFVTFNPFNIYVTQADTKPGCVLKPSNVVTLLRNERNLITEEEVEACKNGFNTWAYVGDINKKPQLTCVFQSDNAQNEFLSNPKVGLGEDIYDDDGNLESK